MTSLVGGVADQTAAQQLSQSWAEVVKRTTQTNQPDKAKEAYDAFDTTLSQMIDQGRLTTDEVDQIKAAVDAADNYIG